MKIIMKNNKLNKKWMIYNQIKSFHLALIVSKSAPMNGTVSAANDEEKLTPNR